MKEQIRSVRWSLILASGLYLALGVVLLVWPGLSAKALCLCIGAATAAYGVFNLLAYFLHKEERAGLWLELAVGVLATAFGAFTLLQPAVVAGILPFVLGIIIVVNGVESLRRAFTLRALGFERWWAVLLLSLAAMALGAVAVCNPFGSLTLLLRLIGGVLLYESLSDLWGIHRVSQLTRALKERMEAAENALQREADAVDAPFQETDDQ